MFSHPDEAGRIHQRRSSTEDNGRTITWNPLLPFPCSPSDRCLKYSSDGEINLSWAGGRRSPEAVDHAEAPLLADPGLGDAGVSVLRRRGVRVPLPGVCAEGGALLQPAVFRRPGQQQQPGRHRLQQAGRALLPGLHRRLLPQQLPVSAQRLPVRSLWHQGHPAPGHMFVHNWNSSCGFLQFSVLGAAVCGGALPRRGWDPPAPDQHAGGEPVCCSSLHHHHPLQRRLRFFFCGVFHHQDSVRMRNLSAHVLPFSVLLQHHPPAEDPVPDAELTHSVSSPRALQLRAEVSEGQHIHVEQFESVPNGAVPEPQDNVSQESEKAVSFKRCVLSWFFLRHLVWLSLMQLRHYFFIGTLNPTLNRLARNDPDLVSRYTNAFAITQLCGVLCAPWNGLIMDRHKGKKRHPGGRRSDSANPARVCPSHLRLHALQETGPVPSTLRLHESRSLKPNYSWRKSFPSFSFLLFSIFLNTLIIKTLNTGRVCACITRYILQAPRAPKGLSQPGL
ncbi:solute carrier family 43 member 3a isoform X2 [Takifugu flavidus]|uniref:solute carrier family 43 member 3a isoform X2 n=1 Tax=Takifugu flavidus TaxID=433684 RepID=UPI002544B7EE|nr:solute carrier family 43 member 3a isoform X2 [Takifugu flavidus]